MKTNRAPLRKNDLLALREIIRSWSVIKYKSKEEDECLFKEQISSSDSDSETDSDLESYLPELLGNQKCNGSRFYKIHEGRYYYQTVENYTEDEFSLYFRMRRKTFETLLKKLTPILPYTRIEPRRAVLFTIFMLAHGENFRSGTSKFGFAISTGHRIFKVVCATIVSLSGQYIKWPSPEDAESIATRFEMISGIPGIVGVTDCCHVSIKQPVTDQDRFFNRKLFHSVLLQGTCDDRMLFIDIKAGDPGKTHEATVFQESPLGMRLGTSPSILLNPQQHLIGNYFYPNSNYMVTPFKNNGHLTAKQNSFNNRLNIARTRIKTVFGQLRTKFRRLTHLDIHEMDIIVDVIVASCILHNFIIMEKDDSLPVAPLNDDDSESEDELPENEEPLYQNKVLKREKLLRGLGEKSPIKKRRKYR